MEEPTTVPGSATPSGADPSGAMPTTQAPGETPETTTPQSLEAVQKELETLKAALKKANEEAKTHRLKANELDKLKAEAEAAKLSETERLQKELADLKSEHDDVLEAQFEQIIDHEIERQAIRAGVNPKHLDKIGKLLDWEDIDIDEDSGAAKNIADLVSRLVKDMPELLGKVTPTSGGATNPGRSASSAPKELSWETIAAMKPDEYAARRAEIQAFMLAHPMRYGVRSKH